MMHQPAFGKASKCLEFENQRLNRENQRLRERNKTLKIFYAELVGKLQLKIEQLEKHLAQFNNAHTPPSQFPPYLKVARKRLSKNEPRGASKRKVIPKLQIDEVRKLRLECCSNCGTQLPQKQTEIGGYTETDIVVPAQVKTVYYKLFASKCIDCGALNRSTKRGLRKTSVGPSLASQIAYEFTMHRLPIRVLTESFRGNYGLQLKATAMLHVLHAVSQKLQPFLDALQHQVQDSSLVQLDETSYPLVLEDRELSWIWVAATKTSVFYWHGKTRGSRELTELFAKQAAEQVAVVDGWTAYPGIFPRRQRCWAHILRESHRLSETLDEKFFHRQLHGFYRQLARTVVKKKYGEVLADRLLAQLQRIISDAFPLVSARFQEWLKKLERASFDLLTCVRVPDVPLDNNFAERCLRSVVLARKIRGSFRSERGATTLLGLLSFFETCRLRGLNGRDEL